MSSVFQKASALFLALFRRTWKCQQFIHSVRQTDINRILMKAFQQDLKFFLLSVLCVPVSTGRVKNAGIIGQVWKHLARDSKKEESKETISAGQYQRLCCHQSKGHYFRFPYNLSCNGVDRLGDTWNAFSHIPRQKGLSCFRFILCVSLKSCSSVLPFLYMYFITAATC